MDAGTVIADVTTGFKSWAKQPLSLDMGVGGWFLFFGLIIAISTAWGLVLHDLKGEL